MPRGPERRPTKPKEEKAKEGDELTILLNNEKPNLRKLFGGHKSKKSTEQIMKEIDEELKSGRK